MTRGQVGLGGNEASPRVTRLGSQLAMSTVLATNSAVKKRKKTDVVVILYRQEFHNFGGFFHFVVDYHVFFCWEATEIRCFFWGPRAEKWRIRLNQGMARVSRSGSAAAPPGPPMGSLGAKRTTI